MIKQTITVANPSGLHARPAAEFTQAASGLACEVFLEKEGQRVNAKSILGLLTLAIAQGNTIDIICDGEGEGEGIAALVQLVENLED